MADEPSILLQLGIRMPDLIAGFLGGVTNAFVFRRSDPYSIVGSMVVGALTANYLGEAAMRYTGTSGGAASFIVGIGGMAICQGIVEVIRKWRPPAPPSPPPKEG